MLSVSSQLALKASTNFSLILVFFSKLAQFNLNLGTKADYI